MAGFNNVTDFYPQITGQLTVYPGPINQVTATVDNNVGTPHVDVQTEYTADGMNINFDFHDMGIPGTDLTVLQPLTEQQKANARQNINAQEVLTFDSAPTQGSQNPVTSGGVYAAEQAIASDVADIKAVIPAAATSQNQLADKEYVDDSINRSSAFFRGNFETRAALMAVPWQTTDPDAPNYVSNNDYAYVADDETHDDESWRYIYVLEEGGSNNGWAAQYRVNESPLTTEQLAAINSGITSAGVAQIETNRTGLASHVEDHSNPHQVTKAQVGLGNVDNTSDADKPVSTAQQAALDALKGDIDGLYDPETASGDIVTIEDANPVLVDELVVDIQPVQDLHGQSAPYPAGGGKNKIPFPYASPSGTVSGGITFTTDAQGRISASGTTTGSVMFTLASNLTFPSGDYTFSIDKASDPLNVNIVDVTEGSVTVATLRAAGSTTVTLDGTRTYTIRMSRTVVDLSVSFANIGVQLEAGSTAHDWEPYANICPISGWTGAKITDCGKNIFDISSATWASGIIAADGSITPNANYQYTSNFYPIKGGVVYSIRQNKTVATSVGSAISFYDDNENFIETNVVFPASSATGVMTATITTPANAAFYRWRCYVSLTAITDFQIEEGSTATTYEAYNGNTINVDWTDEAATVYGGTLTYLGGGKYSLQATKAKKTITGFSTYSQGSVNAFGTLSLDGAPSTGGAVAADFLCSVLNPTTAGGSYTCRRVDSTLYCYFPLGTSSADATALVSGEDVVYPLATLPDPIILTAEDLMLLAGTNNIWADTGEVAVTYAKGALATVLSGIFARLNALEAQA